ncbi:MAG: AbrB/MazE/SpoVT family DNA-binding domain-containing protein [Candidatus Sungbacteria bacterium]|nr:AbrB/MazE/SpoVT family DNA-binding domain-containing protein [Candidatus Sungbacteria bacterium]
MTYQTTITRKGQLKLPKEIRKIMKLPLGSRVELRPDPAGSKLKINVLPSLKSLAGSFAVKKQRDPVLLRAQMERQYRLMEFTPTVAQRKALIKAEQNLKTGKTLSYHELVRKLGFAN